MNESFQQYLIKLYKVVPFEVYEGLLAVFCLGAVLALIVCGIKKGLRFSAVVLLIEYVFLFFCSTVLFRQTVETRGHNFLPFWSYTAIQEGRAELLPENIMNIIVFVPVGVILGGAFRNITWWKVLLIGGGLSVAIEVIQYFYNKGFAETDDVIHNVAGCMIGYGFFLLARYGYERIGKA